MGSSSIFGSVPCLYCPDGSQEQIYPQGRGACLDCVQSTLRAHRRLHLEPVASLCRAERVSFAITFQQFLIDEEYALDSCGFVAYRVRALRKHFLQCVLLSKDSCFKSFTYASNGPTGNISETEDILDHLLSFI